MAQKRIIKIAEKYVEILRLGNYPIERVFLFGSYAKNKPRKDSDIDIAVVLNLKKNTFDLEVELARLRRNIDLRIEPHAFITKDFNEENPLAYEILKTGIRLV